MVRSPRRLFGMDVLGGQRPAQDLLQVNNLFVCLLTAIHFCVLEAILKLLPNSKEINNSKIKI